MDIYVHNLSKNFGKLAALSLPELTIQSGELVGLVGNNGAGKTTFFRLLLDLLKADTGYIMSNGINVDKTGHWKEYTGSYVDSEFLIDFLLPEEYFSLIAKLYKISKEELGERLKMYQHFMSDEILKQSKYIRNYSAGNKQKIGIAGAMLVNPQVLILDEPFNFLDPSSQLEIKRLIKNMNEQLGTTVLISSHNINHITDISTRVILLEKGMIIKDIDNTNKMAEAELNDYFNK